MAETAPNPETSTTTTSTPATNANDSPIENVDEYDITTPSWFYMDGNGLRQGPFSFKEMFLWWKSGYFASDIPEFFNCPVKLVERIERAQEEQLRRGHIEFPVYASQQLNTPPPSAATPPGGDYRVTGSFNPLTGKFQKDDSDSYFAQKGLSSDRAMRMMDIFFDHEKYQEMRNTAAASGEKKKKLVKGTKKFWKKRKAEKRRAKLVAEYLAD